MIVFPNCKINLGLNVLHKRPDGYHDLETIFYPVFLTDILEINTFEKGSAPVFHDNAAVAFSSSGLAIDGPPENNLCVKAYELLRNDFPELPPVQMHLHKIIPMGAGLGGGSSDAAFTLQLLNEYFRLIIPKLQLIDYAAQLGSDCPFFIINKPCVATSRGELLEQIALDLSGYAIALVDCGIHINTGWAFSRLSNRTDVMRLDTDAPLIETIMKPVGQWKDALFNDFEKPVFDEYPVISEIKNALYHHGAIYASMSGSGSTVFGIFEKDEAASFDFPSANIFIV